MNFLKKNKLLVIVPKNSNFLSLFSKSKIFNKKNIKIVLRQHFKLKIIIFLIRGLSEFFMSYILWYKNKKILQ